MSEIQAELVPPESTTELLEHLNDSDPVWKSLGILVAELIALGVVLALTTHA